MIRVLVVLMMFSGCIIPPSLSVDTTDAALNSAPAIISVRSQSVELPEYSTVNFEQGMGELNLIVYDTDINDTLLPKIFVDYVFEQNETPPRSECTPAAGDVMRSSTCPLAGLCLSVDIGQVRTMQVLVFDRQIIEGQKPVHQAMLPPGLSTSRTFYLRCQAKQT